MSDGKPRIGIIIGSTRDTRFGDKPAKWLYEVASRRGDMDVELLDLREFDLPFFNEVASNAWVPSKDPRAIRWQQALATLDGFVVVTAEYNHSITGALKNAFDQAYKEWVRKPIACVGYGSAGGTRAVEHVRQIAVELQMAPTRPAVHIQWMEYLALSKGEKTFDDLTHLGDSAKGMLDDLLWWTNALKAARSA